jgi:diguanylate cyclase (GGDEF)-like protein
MPHRRRTDRDASDGTQLRALVVDDQQSFRDYLSALLSRSGYMVRTATDGPEALATLRDSPPFHLLIIDFEMPRMSGLALIAAIRAHERFGDAYAVMLTARDDLETKVSALGLGFDDFLSKSSGEMEIVAKLSAARRIITRQKRLDETVRELYGLATRDELTGVFNRRFFFAEAERLLAEQVVNLVIFDLDDFKRINDTFGHLAGDRILRDIGSLFLRRTRTEDLIARYGGDEFVMLVADLEPPQVEVLASRIGDEIGRVQWTFGTETFSVGVTTGVACSSLLEKPSVAQLLSAGDRDLYKNKWLRKNPHENPSVYEYEHGREARIVELPPVEPPPRRVKDEPKE